METAPASPVDVSRPTSQGELDRLESKVNRNSYLFLLIGLLHALTLGLELLGFEGSTMPYEGRNWLLVVTLSLKGAMYFMCFLLARRRPHSRGFGLGLLFIVAWLGSTIWVVADSGIHETGWVVIALLFFSGLFSFLTARKYDRALEERDAKEAAGAGTSGP